MSRWVTKLLRTLCGPWGTRVSRFAPPRTIPVTRSWSRRPLSGSPVGSTTAGLLSTVDRQLHPTIEYLSSFSYNLCSISCLFLVAIWREHLFLTKSKAAQVPTSRPLRHRLAILNHPDQSEPIIISTIFYQSILLSLASWAFLCRRVDSSSSFPSIP